MTSELTKDGNPSQNGAVQAKQNMASAPSRQDSAGQSAGDLPLSRTSTRNSQASLGDGDLIGSITSSVMSAASSLFGSASGRRKSVSAAQPDTSTIAARRASVSAANAQTSPSGSPSVLNRSHPLRGSPASRNVDLPSSSPTSSTNNTSSSSPSSATQALPRVIATGALAPAATTITRNQGSPAGQTVPLPIPSRPNAFAASSAGSGNSIFSQAQASTPATTPSRSPQPARVPAMPSPGGALTPGRQPLPTPQAVQSRLRTLPRLASYSAPKTITESAGRRPGSRDAQQRPEAEYDTSTTMSGTDTAADDDESETDDDSDGDDAEHDERDVRGGQSGMQRALQRPALPTLSSTRGFAKPGPGRMTPFTNPASQFSGWTTFQTSTPTPGPMRTAKPHASDNIANASYFDVRPMSKSAQTPKADYSSGAQRQTPGGFRTYPQTPGARAYPPQTPSANASPANRIRVETAVARGILTSPSQSFVQPISPVTTSKPSSPLSPPSPTASTAQSDVNAQPPVMLSIGQAATTVIDDDTGRPTIVKPAFIQTSRPSFKHRQSRSLVDLRASFREAELTPGAVRAPIPPTVNAIDHAPAPTASIATSEVATPASGVHTEPVPQSLPETSESLQSGDLGAAQVQNPSLNRRHSLPEMRIDPPVYQIDDDFHISYAPNQIPVSREEEGVEQLPDYSCDVHIEGYVPRKMEFLQPGTQAKDRRWKRQYMILHGTSIKIYKSDPRSKAVAGEEAPPTPGIHKDNFKPMFPSGPSSSKASSTEAVNRQRRGTNASILSTASTNSANSATSGNSEKSLPWNTKTAQTQNARVFDPDVPVHVHARDSEESGLSSLQHPSALLAKAGDNRVVRHYTLQGAESGLAADYLKRRHVVRIRAEGEQFLIQANDDRAVIDWIEALQAATNTALDLDVRPLPKFITLPRRRRRRARPADGTAAAAPGAAGAAGGTATPTRDATTARSDALNNMLADEQADYDRQRNGLVS